MVPTRYRTMWWRYRFAVMLNRSPRAEGAQLASWTVHISPRSGWPALAKALKECSPGSASAASWRTSAGRSSQRAQHHLRWNGDAASGFVPTWYS